MNKNLLKLPVILALAAVVCLPGMAMASIVGPSAFSGSALTEGFEGISPNTANTGILVYTNFFSIGTTAVYTFGSGVSLSNPIPALDVLAGGPYIEDFSLGSGGYNAWGTNGNAYSAPFGTGYIGFQPSTTYLEFTMPQKMYRVGAYVTGAPGSVTMEIYGDSGLIESQKFTIGTTADWATSSNFIGLQTSGKDITKVIFRDTDMGLDNLRADPVPLPPSLLLLGSGLVGLGLLHRRKPTTV